MAIAITYIDIFVRFKKMHDFREVQPIESVAKQSHSYVLVHFFP